jgi:hypothetical protein|tara:strand:- start:3663 stop:4013 length:351 start_codon:yes stop_codon:yes gene_type:complete
MPEIPEPKEIPAPEPLPTPQQAPLPPVMPPVTPTPVQPSMPAAPPPAAIQRDAPAPVVVQSTNPNQDQAVIKRRKSKRRELQQQAQGASALRIPRTQSIGSTPAGGTGSTGLNIPR